MLTLADQLHAASAHAARLAAEMRSQQADWEARKARGLAPRRISLKAALRTRLPDDPAAAMSLAEIRKQLADLDFAESGLTGALSRMTSAGELSRTGEKSGFRYYRKSN